MSPTTYGGDWRSAAACRSVDPEWFFPSAEAGDVLEVQVRRARAVCARCPVAGECLDFALQALAHGIAGGMTADERRDLRATDARPYLDSAGRLIGASRDATAEVGRAQIARGRRTRVVEHEFGVSRRTAQRWAAQARTSTKEGSHGGNRAPLGSPTPAPRQGHAPKDQESR